MKIPTAVRFAPLALAAFVVASGCQSDPMNPSYSAISSNLTPELAGLHQRPVDMHRTHAVDSNQNLRMAMDDIQRAWLLDQPSQLSPFPVMRTSGNP